MTGDRTRTSSHVHPEELPPDAAIIESLMKGEPDAAMQLWHASCVASPDYLPPVDLIERIAETVPSERIVPLVMAVVTPPGPPGQATRMAKANLLIKLGAEDEADRMIAEFRSVAPRAVAGAIAQLRRAIGAGDVSAVKSLVSEIPKLAGQVPSWFWQFRTLVETGKAQMGQVMLSVPDSAISPQVMMSLANGKFEADEIVLLKSDLRREDRLLDLGTGTGLCAISAGLSCPEMPMRLVEGNPAMQAVIRENLALNGLSAELIPALVSDHDGETDFVVQPNFAASSVYLQDATLPRIRVDVADVRRLQREFHPTIISMDIEGAEKTVIPALDLGPLRRLVIEFHPHLIGHKDMSSLLALLFSAGFELSAAPECQVFAFVHPER